MNHKKFIKIGIIFIFIIMIGGIVFTFYQQQRKVKSPYNIDELSEEFMEEYFNNVKKLEKESDKENTLIVTSYKKIKDSYGAKEIIEAPNYQYYLLYESEKEKEEALEKFQKDQRIESVDENILRYVSVDYDSWGIQKMVLDEATATANANNLDEVVVAVLDTGCDVELANRYYPGKIKETYNVLTHSENDMSDEHGHGTHVLGTIAEGTPNNVKIIPIKISADGSMRSTDIVDAINYVNYNHKAVVMNMSFGGTRYTTAEKTAIDAATNNNIISVAAAGNDNSPTKNYPASLDNVISIASVDSSLNKSNFSNWGASITFAAPGSAIKSIMNKNTILATQNGNNSDDDHEIINGTSMATPHAVAAVALLKSYNKDLTVDNVIDLLKRTAIDLGDPGKDNYYGYGFITFANAEFCDGEDCDEFNVFKKTLEDLDIVKIEGIDSNQLVGMNYGNESNILGAEIKLYYSTNGYYTKHLYELDGVEITGYDPTDYSIQEVTVRYQGKETIISIDNRAGATPGYDYEVIDENHIRITEIKYSPSPMTIKTEKVIIPSIWDGYTVSEIGKNNTTMKMSLGIVDQLGLPSTITKINDYAFYHNAALKKIEAPNAGIEIGDYAFCTATNLTTFTGTIKSVGQGAFLDARQIDHLSLSNDIERIEKSAFAAATNLEHINIPDSITYIGEGAFSGTSIESITIPSHVTKIEKETFYNCTNLDSVIFPEGLTEIGKDAFHETNIRDVTIPKTVTNIDPNAFSYVGALQTITVDSNNPVYDSRNNCNAIIETATNTLVQAADRTTIPDDVTKIGESAYRGLHTESGDFYTIPSHITSIGTYAFYDTNYRLKIPRTVSSLGENFMNKSTYVFVYSDSYTKTYVDENGHNYHLLDPSKVTVGLQTKNYVAFESVDIPSIVAQLEYNENPKRTERYFNPEANIEIIYPENRSSFRYGDTYVTASFETDFGEHIEKQINVTVTKATPTYTTPGPLEGDAGQRLADISLPEHFTWMNPAQVLTGSGEQIYKAKFIPDDTNNYEIVENIDIVVNVIFHKTIIEPNITVVDKAYDGTLNIPTNSISISNLASGEYTIIESTLDNANVGTNTASITLRLSDQKFNEYMFAGEVQERSFLVPVTVIPQTVTIPTLKDKTYTYNGEEQTIELNNFDSNKMDIMGNKRTNAGTQNVVINLINNNYKWSNNTTDDIVLEFTIQKQTLTVQDDTKNVVVRFDGNHHTITPVLNNNQLHIKYMNTNNEYTLDSPPTYIDVGVYTIKYKAYIDDNYTEYYGEKTVTIAEALVKVTFYANNGTEENVEQEMEKLVSTKLRKNTFTKENHTFNGWNTEPDGTGNPYEDEAMVSIAHDITLYAQWEEQQNSSYEITEYTVTSNMIDGISPKTSLNDFKNHFILNGYTVEVDLGTKEYIYTGSKTILYKNGVKELEFTNVVRGDVNGNGKIDIIDYIRIMKDIMDTEKLSGAYKLAADVNKNDKIDIIDYIRIMKIIMEE